MAMYPCLTKPTLSFPTLTGSIVTFNSQYAGLPLKSHTVAVVASQSGTGTPSPSNPRSISGWDGQNIYHSGADTSNPNIEYVAFGSTIYGGNRDARTGVLTVTHGYYDLGNINSWTYYTSGDNPIFYSEIPLDGKIYSSNEDIDCICSEYEAYPTATSRSAYTRNLADKQFGFIYGTHNIVIRDDDYTDEISFKTAMSGVYICYELATPQTIQLQPCPIDTLEGVNNIWADTGDTTLQYPKFG